MSTIPQNKELLKCLIELIEAHRPVFKQERTYHRAIALIFGELIVFARHTITQILLGLGLVKEDWSAWYRFFSAGRFDYDKASEILFAETLAHVNEDELYVVGGDATQTPRSSRKMEGSGWLRNLRTPPFMVGIHAAQRWFNGSWLMPAEKGYSRAMPLRWLPAFTEKSEPQAHEPMKEWEAAVAFLTWLMAQFIACGRHCQQVLMLGDGSYDTLNLWKHLPDGVLLLARSAKNRALYYLPDKASHANRKYGERAPTPQAIWQVRTGWKQCKFAVRGKMRHLKYKLSQPVLRKGAAHRPLILIVLQGKQRQKNGRTYRRKPLPFLVNAIQDEQGNWLLPLPIETLLFWAWQRWELEVCHRELKSNFGLGDKQCWNPQAAVLSVQWSAWVYSLLLLAGYRSWGLCGAPDVPTRWWRGSQRWSLNTLWRAYRAALWDEHDFQPLFTPFPNNSLGNMDFKKALYNAIYGSARS